MIAVFLGCGLWLSWTSHLSSVLIEDALVAHVFTGILNNLAALFNSIFVGGVKNYSPIPRFIATYLNPTFMANAPMGLTQAHCYQVGRHATEDQRLKAGCPSFDWVSSGGVRRITAEGFVENFVASTF